MSNFYQGTGEKVKDKLQDYQLSESDTRAKIIDPKLYQVGWKEELIIREYPISVGKIELIGDVVKRQPPKKADYILKKPSGDLIGVIEAKASFKSPLEGLPQAKEYAQKLSLPFAFSTNGYQIEEFDFINNKQSTIENFPSPEELEKRLYKIQNEDFLTQFEKIINLQPPEITLRAYQLGAVKSVIQSILKNKKRILLNLATGTGKTVIAFSIVWKLIKSGYFKKVLFVADRKFLRDQAYNVFSPFGDNRALIEEGKTPKHQSIFFSIYQALYSDQHGVRLFEKYPADFFDLVIIDECHRSGFGTWHSILKHFSQAFHLGMTATPKRDDNIDTYQYFSEPVYVYSYADGVKDGFLAPFIVHRVYTNIDKEGKLVIEEAKKQGAEILAPDEDLRSEYSRKEFEKTITLPDRTKKIASHLSNLLREIDPMAKTMVFCVDSDHADLMAKEIQNQCSDLGYSNYATSIIARNGDIKETDYQRFRDSEKKTPVVATTVDLLTTGVDVPSVKNIVIVKSINSKVVFKQIIGRGSRLDPSTDKNFFRIIDYTGATELFDEWEKPPPEPEEEETEDSNPKYFIRGKVIDYDSQRPIFLAKITLQLGPNNQTSTRTDENGFFIFNNLPKKKFQLSVSASGYKEKTETTKPKDLEKDLLIIELIPKIRRKVKVLVKGLPVEIVEEEKMILEKEGKILKVDEYIKYTKDEIGKKITKLDDLRLIWIDPEKRKQFLEELSEKSIYPEIIAELLEKSDVDSFDLIASLVFNTIPLTRDQRVEALKNYHKKFIDAYSDNVKEIIFALIEKYRAFGIEEIENPNIFELSPFDKIGKLDGVIKRFGGLDELKQFIINLRKNIYAYDE